MSNSWQTVRLGEILTRSTDIVDIRPENQYREITVRLWGNGVVERGRILGVEMAGAKRFVARRGDFIASRIDARNGAMGIVPEALDGAVVSNDFPLFRLNPQRLIPAYLGWISKTVPFVSLCARASEGTTNRVRLKEDRFLSLEIQLPPLNEQLRLVERIEEIAGEVENVRSLRSEQDAQLQQVLRGAFWRVAEKAVRMPMRDVAPLVRRSVDVAVDATYPELGIRSFGKGTFHKPALTGMEVGSKRIFRIEPGDLLFSNVFAWEGAIAVARPEDVGRYGSHRFISCVPHADIATASFLCFYFLTERGLSDIQAASPGGAGRNRTLGLEALEQIEVPVPPIQGQRWFDRIQAEVRNLKREQLKAVTQIDALLPAILDRAFRGEL